MAEQTVRIGGHRLRLSNLDKVLYPETGTTKGEVIDYYTRIAPLLLPHVRGRPATRKRWPDGVGTSADLAAPFFAKALEAGAPSWVERYPIGHSSGAKVYPLVDDIATLVFLAQAASLELHVPQWRFGTDGVPQNPDRLVLDLDPGPGTGLAECAEVARWTRTILQQMGLDPVPVTSGSNGIHVYARLDGRSSSSEVNAVAKELARALEADHPDLVISQMTKAARAGKVFIDWSQNNGSKTTIAPYSLRGLARPTVAAPRTWLELDDPNLRHLTFDEVLTRGGDPMASVDDDGPLRSYIEKRSVGRTPEPVPSVAHGEPSRPGLPRFVIQEHHARRLHWDLRLERDGVLVSWAVPRGIPPTTGENALAIMTEDHPLPYLDFAGEIPHGQYGAGTMAIWDTGHYELEKWRDDEVIVTLHGRRDPVRVALIRTEGAGEKSQWLLHRMTTDATGHPHRRRTTAEAVSASTDRHPDLHPMLAVRATAGIARTTTARWGDAWAEMKWDGIRGLGIWDGQRLRLRSRNGNDLTSAYPELTAGDLALGSDPAVVDGEIVALDGHGRPSFPLLQRRMNLAQPRDIEREAQRTPVQLYLFDILSIGGRDVTSLPLVERRGILEHMTRDATPPVAVPPVFDDVDEALEASVRFGLEGIVVKDPASTYRRGERSDRWVKVKHSRTQEVVIGGIRPGRGNRTGSIGSLLVGVPADEGLRYAGRVGSGFSDEALARLLALLAPLRRADDPFVGVPAADARDALWVRPELVAEVEFAEFTPGGILRQARWRGLRPDKDPSDVVREA